MDRDGYKPTMSHYIEGNGYRSVTPSYYIEGGVKRMMPPEFPCTRRDQAVERYETERKQARKQQLRERVKYASRITFTVGLIILFALWNLFKQLCCTFSTGFPIRPPLKTVEEYDEELKEEGVGVEGIKWPHYSRQDETPTPPTEE